MDSNATQIKELRELTGCGIMDCKEALKESGDDLEKAALLLRKKGKSQAEKKATRETKEGVVVSYVHSNDKIGVLVTLLCETDFVARNEKFKELAHNIALHVAAMDPVAVAPEDVAEEAVAQEKEIAQEQADASGKPDEIKEKMIEGKLKKFKEERALLTQAYVKDQAKTVADVINESIAELGENITVAEFVRLAI
jgi:elongation factor Ts